MMLGGKGLAQLPQADGVDGEPQVGGDLLQGNLVLPAPVLESNREAGADVALEFALAEHGGSLGDIWAGSKRGAAVGKVISGQ